MFSLSLTPIVDPDFGWHMRTGEYIWQNKQIPYEDLFSFTQPNYPYVYHSWASEVIIFGVYALGGVWGVTILYGLIQSMGLIVLWLANQRTILGLILSSLLVLPLRAMLGIGLRVQTFSFLFMALLYFVLSRNTDKPRSNTLQKTLPFLFLVWANTHGGFIVGIVFYFIFLTASFVSNIEKIDTLKFRQQQKTAFSLFILSCLATLINPYGLRLYTFAIQMVTNFEINSQNLDWSPVYLLDRGLILIQFALLVWAMLVLLHPKPSLRNKILTALFSLLTYTTNRFLLALIIVLVPTFIDLVESYLSTQKRQRFLKFYLSLTLLLGLVSLSINNLEEVVIAYSSPEKHSLYTEEIIPIPQGGIEFLRTQGYQKNLFHDINWGGFLIWLMPKVELFADTKMDNYIVDGRSFAFEYIDTAMAKEGWEQALDNYEINTILIPPDIPLVKKLNQSPEWSIVYQDRVSVIYKRDTPI